MSAAEVVLRAENICVEYEARRSASLSKVNSLKIASGLSDVNVVKCA